MITKLSVVHARILQPKEFSLAEKMQKPTAKLGEVIDKIIKYRKSGDTIYNSIKKACEEVDYYSETWEKKIPDITDTITHSGIKARSIVMVVCPESIVMNVDSPRFLSHLNVSKFAIETVTLSWSE